MTWHATFTVYWWPGVCLLIICWWLWRMTPCSTMTHSPCMTWHLVVSLLTYDLTWHWTPTTCWWLMLMTCHATFTVYWWHDVCSLTMCWWRRSMTPFSIMTHCLSMTWRRDVSLLNDDLTWHRNTHYMLVTHVDDLTCDIYCVLMTWCPLTHHVLMTDV